MAGFCSLTFLDLSFNFVGSESDLLAVAGFSRLEMIDIRGNPLVSNPKQRTPLRELYSILYSNLVEPCHVAVIIHDPDPDSGSDHILRPDSSEDGNVQPHVESENHEPEPDLHTFLTSVNDEAGVSVPEALVLNLSVEIWVQYGS
jgi:hypothetical protein